LKADVRKETTFASGLTGKAILLALIPVLISAWLIRTGLFYLDVFPPVRDFAIRFTFGFFPIILGAAILIVLIVAVKANIGIGVTVSPQAISYSRGDVQFTTSWEMLAFSAPHPSRKFMRVITISNGEELAQLHELFFPQFDKLLKIISDAKKTSRSSLNV
jgi:hypothetical protein